MRLVIVESPAKAKTIEKYLGDGYTVAASVGHVRDLPKSNKKAISIDEGFIPHYEISKGKEEVIKKLKALAKKSEEVILATDPDREGEAIAWHLKEITGLKNPKRIVFNEITKEAVTEALKNPRAIDENLRKAQEARRVLDRLVGYDLSGLIWKKVRYGLSAGRVQSPALRIIMEREREIRAFVPEQFWVITALTNTKKGATMSLACEEEPRDEAEVTRILTVGKQGAWKVADIKETEAKRSPRPPFTTSTLQQSASTRFGFSPSRTMSIAQKLYEAGHITYMRTDSVTLSTQALGEIAGVVEKAFGKQYVEVRRYATKSKSAQEAHEAVRPTHASVARAGRNRDEERLYELIRARTLASQMADAKLLRTKVLVNVEPKGSDKPIPDFSVNGSRLLFDGWLKADPAARADDVEVPEVAAGESLSLISIDAEGKETQPSDRYTEAGLIKELEKRGIGRPSTYASIMKTLADREYVVKEGRTLIPTDTGDVVSSFLETHFPSYISDSFTAEMEDELDEIAEGKREYAKTLGDFYKPFLKDVKAKDKLEKATTLGEAPKEFPCPKCGAGMVYKLSRTGKFMSCSKFPECVGARKIDGTELEGPKETGEACPDCGEKEGGKLLERDGRFGRFIACSRYPKCKYVKKDPAEEAKMKTGVHCPECKDGEIVERRGRFGPFFSCSSYPTCKFAMKARPTGNVCKECGALMMEGTKTIPERCSNKNCLAHNPHKLKK